MGASIIYECWRVLRHFCGLFKKCKFVSFNFSQNIAKVMLICMSKVGQNSTALKSIFHLDVTLELYKSFLE